MTNLVHFFDNLLQSLYPAEFLPHNGQLGLLHLLSPHAPIVAMFTRCALGVGEFVRSCDMTSPLMPGEYLAGINSIHTILTIGRKKSSQSTPSWPGAHNNTIYNRIDSCCVTAMSTIGWVHGRSRDSYLLLSQ